MAKPRDPRKNLPPIPAAHSEHSEQEPPSRPPLWETLSMCAAFVLLWLWFAAHRSAQNAGLPLGRQWAAALLFALAAMAFIMVRRMQRFKRALEESQPQSRRSPAAAVDAAGSQPAQLSASESN